MNITSDEKLHKVIEVLIIAIKSICCKIPIINARKDMTRSFLIM